MKKHLTCEMLDERVIGKELSLPVSVLASVDSTNTEARRRILAGEPMPQLILAEEQSAGRGRMGRSFYSPKGTGIYLTLAFRATEQSGDTLPLTTAAAVAVHRAIEDVTGIATGIKWVNDLYYKGRKISGILAESMLLDGERYVILGVGVNLYTREFPVELSGIAGGLTDAGVGLRNRLAAALCAELSRLIQGENAEEVIGIYRKHSLVLGKQIVYTENGISYTATAEEIDGQGRLTVRHGDGRLHTLASGEISLRLYEE